MQLDLSVPTIFKSARSLGMSLTYTLLIYV